MRSLEDTIKWYREHETTEELGFNPDGMCLKIVRTARGLNAMFPTALSSQEATPESHRIKNPADIRKGMVGYYDDPNDENPFGHVVTYVGRVKNEDPNSLKSLLCRTNSVVKGEIVVVRGNYFNERWGDSFQFASDWLNGQKLTLRASKKPPLGKAEGLREAVRLIDRSIKHHEKAGHLRLVEALKRDKRELKKTIKQFSK